MLGPVLTEIMALDDIDMAQQEILQNVAVKMEVDNSIILNVSSVPSINLINLVDILN